MSGGATKGGASDMLRGAARFCGLTSRCTMPREWMNSKRSSSVIASCETVAMEKVERHLCSNSSALGPSNSRMSA